MRVGHATFKMNFDAAKIANGKSICSVDELFQQRDLHNFANHVKSSTMTLCVL